MSAPVDKPHFVHNKVNDHRKQADIAQLAGPVSESPSVIGSGACEKYPGAHKRGDIGHNKKGPSDCTAAGGKVFRIFGPVFLDKTSHGGNKKQKTQIDDKNGP